MKKFVKWLNFLVLVLFCDPISAVAQNPKPTITYWRVDEPVVGEWAYIYVTVQNNGGPTGEGGITWSFPSIASPWDMNRLVPFYPEWEPVIRAPGDPIYHRNGSLITANNAMIELVDTDWQAGESHHLTVKVKTTEVGTFPIYLRSAMHDNASNTYTNTPATGPLDQQGWNCVDASLNVTANYADPFWMGNAWVALEVDGTTTWHAASHLSTTIEAEELWIAGGDIQTWPGYAARGACDYAQLFYSVNSEPFQSMSLSQLGHENENDKWVVNNRIGPFAPGDRVEFYFKGQSDQIVGDSGIYRCTVLDNNGGANYQFEVAEPMPDLIVTEIRTKPAILSAGSPFVIEATVRNQGTVVADPPGWDMIEMGFWIDGNYVGGERASDWCYSSAPNGGEYIFTSIALTAPGIGTHTIRARADCNDSQASDVEESNETNNVLSVDVTIGNNQIYTLTATAGPNGTVSPASTNVSPNARAAFTVTPNTGYARDSVDGDAWLGGSWNGNTYTTAPVTRDRNLNFTFSPIPQCNSTVSIRRFGSTLPAVLHYGNGFNGGEACPLNSWIFHFGETATFPIDFIIDYDLDCDARISAYITAYQQDGSEITKPVWDRKVCAPGSMITNLKPAVPDQFPGQENTYALVATVAIFTDDYYGGEIPPILIKRLLLSVKICHWATPLQYPTVLGQIMISGG